MAAEDFKDVYRRDIAKTFRIYESLGERAMAQVSDRDLHALIDPESNSIAIVVKHLSGNLRSRFTDFLTSDGEKPTRNRDSEFEMPEEVSRLEVLHWWETSWTITLEAIDRLTSADLDRTVQIRGESMQVPEALNRLATHTAYHVGQIVFLAKHFTQSHWSTLSIPRKR